MMSLPEDLEIRRLTLDDPNDEFGRIVLESYLALPGMPRDDEYEEELVDVGARVENGVVLGAFLEGKPVGSVTFVAGPEDPYAERQLEGEASFRMLAVDTAAQGLGIGEALTHRCIEEAKLVGATAVFIFSGSWMPKAHRLYRKLGFVQHLDRDWVVGEPPFRLLAFRLEL